MAKSRCCGFSILVWVIYIGLFAILQSIYTIMWNTCVMLMYNRPEIFMNQGTLEKVAKDLGDLENKTLVYKILSVSILASCIWFTSSVFLIVGNSTRSFCSISIWIILTIIITAGDVGTTSYFAAQLWRDFTESHVHVIDVLKDMTNLPTTANLILMLLFSKGIVVLLLNVISAVTVCQRNVEILPKKKWTAAGPSISLAEIPLTRTNITDSIAESPLTSKSKATNSIAESLLTSTTLADESDAQKIVTLPIPV